MSLILSRAALMAGCITLAGAGVALAQSHPAPPADGAPKVERRVMIMGGPGGPGGPGMHGPGMRGGMHGPMDPEKHIQHLRDVLQLRPDQEGALKAFIAAMKPPERPAPAADGAAPARPAMPGTTPERLAMAEKRMAEHQTRMKKRNDAIRAFYGQLTPAQQKAFDALHMGMGMGGGRMHHPGGPGGERHVRIIRSGGGAAPMVWEGEGGPGGGMFFADGAGDDEVFEFELEGGPDESDQ